MRTSWGRQMVHPDYDRKHSCRSSKVLRWCNLGKRSIIIQHLPLRRSWLRREHYRVRRRLHPFTTNVRMGKMVSREPWHRVPEILFELRCYRPWTDVDHRRKLHQRYSEFLRSAYNRRSTQSQPWSTGCDECEVVLFSPQSD